MPYHCCVGTVSYFHLLSLTAVQIPAFQQPCLDHLRKPQQYINKCELSLWLSLIWRQCWILNNVRVVGISIECGYCEHENPRKFLFMVTDKAAINTDMHLSRTWQFQKLKILKIERNKTPINNMSTRKFPIEVKIRNQALVALER